MASATTSRPLPALTSAHQRQLQQLIAVLEAHGTPERDLALLAQLAADLPRFRAGLPAAARAALEDLDQNETAIAAAYHDLREALREALVTRDRKTVYRVDDGIPVLLVEDGIATAQLEGFPRQ